MSLYIRRVVDGLGGVHWILHEHGKWATPIRVIADLDWKQLVDQAQQQGETQPRKAKAR